MKRKILVADDSITVRKVVELTFSGEDFDIVPAPDGAVALERARAEHPALIVSDVGMPGMDGYELCRRVKADPDLAHVPFLFLKGTFESFDEERASRCGADGFIVKPFESQDLIRRAKELIAAAPQLASPPAPRPEVAAAQPSPAVEAGDFEAPFAYVPPALQAAPAEAPPPPPPAPAAVSAPPPAPAAAARPSVEEEFALSFGIEEQDLVPPPPPAPVRLPEAFAPPTRPEPLPEAFAPPAAVAPPPLAEPVDLPEPIPEEDLWSEVVLRDRAAPVPGTEEEGSLWPVEPVDLLEEAVAPAPAEEIFEEISPDRLEMPAAVESALEPAPFVEPQAAPLPEAAAAPPGPAGAAAPAISPADLERAVAARIEPVLREVLAPLVGELARKVIDEVAWEVIPDLAEAMIRREIERIRQSTGRG